MNKLDFIENNYDTINGLSVSKYKVLKSNAGYYIGRTYIDEECGGMEFPYDRLSKYYSSKEIAQTKLNEADAVPQ